MFKHSNVPQIGSYLAILNCLTEVAWATCLHDPTMRFCKKMRMVTEKIEESDDPSIINDWAGVESEMPEGSPLDDIRENAYRSVIVIMIDVFDEEFPIETCRTLAVKAKEDMEDHDIAIGRNQDVAIGHKKKSVFSRACKALARSVQEVLAQHS